jgi:hypothetical protein
MICPHHFFLPEVRVFKFVPENTTFQIEINPGNIPHHTGKMPDNITPYFS